MTLKDFKAQFKVGARMYCEDHWLARHKHSRRTVTKVQANGYFFTNDGSFKSDGVTLERFWSEYPLKSELTFNDDGSFTVRPLDGVERGAFWTLRFLEEATCN